MSVTIELSTGHEVEIFPVTLAILLRIAAQEERTDCARLCHRTFAQFIEGPDGRAWEKGRRLRYFHDRWAREIRTTARMIVTATLPAPKGKFALFSRLFRSLRAQRIIKEATWEDIEKIIGAYRQVNDIDMLAETTIGPKGVESGDHD